VISCKFSNNLSKTKSLIKWFYFSSEGYWSTGHMCFYWIFTGLLPEISIILFFMHSWWNILSQFLSSTCFLLFKVSQGRLQIEHSFILLRNSIWTFISIFFSERNFIISRLSFRFYLLIFSFSRLIMLST
jgi:hypothetical protein